jgi:hypothetical protein
VKLQELLSISFASDETGTIPGLRERFALARTVATALYQLQYSQWLHRTLSSHNVVFFLDRATGRPRIEMPFVVGLQYSRPDDQPREAGRQPFSEGALEVPPALALYLQPDLSNDESRQRKRRRYQGSDDVHSLGIVLIEIAMWEPVSCFLGDNQDVVSTAEKIRKCAEKELASEVGETYQDAVVACLQRLRAADRDSDDDIRDAKLAVEYDGVYGGEDPEVGLEVDLFWKVIQEISQIAV